MMLGMAKLHHYMLAFVAAGTLGFSVTSQAANIDACHLISADEASKIIGTQLTVHAMDTSAAGPNAGSMCSYAGKKYSSDFMLIAGHVDYTDVAKEVASRKKEMLSDIPPGLPVPSFTDVKGLGDAAYLSKTSSYFQLHVLKHGNVIVINRNTAANAQAVEQVKQIARTALMRLK